MQEYSRIIIEEYCRKYPKTKKAAFLEIMVGHSYEMDYIPTDGEMIRLEQLINRERNPELLEALEDLNDFLCGY